MLSPSARRRLSGTRGHSGASSRQHLLPGLPGDRPVGELFQELPGVLLVLADGVVGQVLADAVHQVRAGPRGACLLRLRESGGHGRAFLRVREFPA